MGVMSYSKCFSIGVLASNELKIPWESFAESDEWISFSSTLNEIQIHYLKRGYTGLEFKHEKCESEDVIMPFGKKRGQLMSTLPIKYLEYLNSQEWIHEWPCVYSWLARNKIQNQTDGS
jgi:hypothetical protein